MDYVVIDIGNREQTAGLTYVALTKVKSLEGVIIQPPFDLPRLQAW